MIQNEREIRHEYVLQAVRQMMTAARTAPKGKGIDIIEVAMVTDEDIKRACVDGNQKAYGADELVRIFGGMLEKAYPEVCDKALFTVYDRCGDHISQRL